MKHGFIQLWPVLLGVLIILSAIVAYLVSQNIIISGSFIVGSALIGALTHYAITDTSYLLGDSGYVSGCLFDSEKLKRRLVF